MPYQDGSSIDLTFICDEQVNKGVLVNLKASNTGVVELADAVTEFPMVVSVCNAEADEKVTVKTPFVAIVKGEVDENSGLNYGDALYQTGKNAAGLPKFAAHAASGFITGIVISDDADDETEITVGILHTPVYKYIHA